MLISRRPEEGLLGGFWEFPDGNPAGVRYDRGPRTAVVRHGVKNDRLLVEAFDCRWRGGQPSMKDREPRWRWATRNDLKRLTFTGAHRKIIQSLADEQPSRITAGT